MPQKYYAVRVGRRPGVYLTWEECKQQVDKFSGAKFKSFPTRQQAEEFAGISSSSTTATTTTNANAAAATTTTRKRKNEDDSQPQHRQAPARTTTITTTTTTPINKKPRVGYTTTTIEDKSTNNNGVAAGRSSSKTDEGITVVYTDGACAGNGRVAAKAGIGVYFGKNDPRNVSECLVGKQTNQRAELTAAMRALEIVSGDIEIRTDSKYTIKGVTEWSHSWVKNGWRTAANTEVQNRDLFERILHLCKNRKVIWTYVPGHSGFEGNEEADRLAVEGINK